jgi:hypothetical protein
MAFMGGENATDADGASPVRLVLRSLASYDSPPRRGQHVGRKPLEGAPLHDYMGGVFEHACRQAVRLGTVALPFSPMRVGEWWDAKSTEQIDLVALDGEGSLLAAECKWGEATIDDLMQLERRARILATEGRHLAKITEPKQA